MCGVCTTGERRGAYLLFFSLHMGHCIVMSEALLVVVGCCSSGGSHRIGTYSHFEMSRLARPPPLPSMPGDMLWVRPDARRRLSSGQGRRGRAATCHVWWRRTPDKKKPRRKDKSGSGTSKSGTVLHFSVFFLFMEELRKNNPLRVTD